METVLNLVKAVLGIFAVMTIWLGIQALVRRRTRCGRDKDVLDFMLHGCGGCTSHAPCRNRQIGKEPS